jgi:hypothetical protein
MLSSIVPVAIVALILMGSWRYGVLWYAKQRSRELAEFAKRQDLDFFPGIDFGSIWSLFLIRKGVFPGPEVIRMFQYFKPILPVSTDFAMNIIVGLGQERTFYSFDYEYLVGDQKRQVGVVAMRIPINLRSMALRPPAVGDAVLDFAGLGRIEFESFEFNQRYHVYCDDEKFAFDLVHPELMELLLAMPVMHWQIGGPFIVITYQRFFSIGELTELKRLLERFVELIPTYVKQDHGFEPKWTSTFSLE